MDTKRLVQQTAGPMTGAAAVFLGTLAAVLVFPDQPSPPGALFVPALLMSVGILFVPVMRTVSQSSGMLNAESFVALGYIFWLLLDLLQGAYDLGDATDAGLRNALIAIGVSAASMWVGVSGRAWRLPKWIMGVASRPLDHATVSRMVPICFLLGMSNFAYSVNFNIPEMFSYLGNNRWDVPWGRGQLGGWEAFRDQLPYFGYALPSLTALVIARRGWLRFGSWLAVGASGIMLLFLAQSGGRRIIGVTVGAALLVWIQANPGMRIRKLVVVFAATIAMAWTMQFMLNIRTRGYEDFRLRGVEANDTFHVDDNFLRLAQVIDIVPAKHDYVYFQQILFTLVRPVPRVFWPGKPINPGFDLPAEVGMRGLSLSTSIVGEWYLTLGWVAVAFGGWLHGRLASAANSLHVESIQARNPIVYALSVMVLVSGMRSMQDLVIMSYALVAWWGVNRMVAPRAAGAS